MEDVVDVAQHGYANLVERSVAKLVEEPVTAVDGRAAAECDNQFARTGSKRRLNKVREPRGGRLKWVSLGRFEQGQPDRLRRLDHGEPPIRHKQKAGAAGAAERIGHRRLAPLASPRGLQDVGGALTTVSERQLEGLGSGVSDSVRQRTRRARRGQNALEAVWCADELQAGPA